MEENQEEAFVRAFILPAKRDRYLQLLANPTKRRKILGTLYHTLSTIEERTSKIASRDHFPEPIEKMLRQKGAREMCYLISPVPALDQQVMPLREALETLKTEDLVAIVCCLPGRLAYYKAEWTGYILEYTPPRAST
jgi:hypothetical protein